MGEAKRKRRIVGEAAVQVAREFADKGLLIEAGFVSLMAVAYDSEVPLDQRNQLREAFFAGAQHLFSCIMGMLEPGDEPTPTDYSRMDLIHNELQRFIDDYEVRYGLKPPPHPTPQ